MQAIIFYDSKNVPYMTWYNFSYNQQNGTLLFNVQFEYSIFNIPSLIFPNAIRRI
jgi:hypothetical protein